MVKVDKGEWDKSKGAEENHNFNHYRAELGWREFSYSQLFYNNQLPTKNLQSKFDNFQWKDDESYKNAWKK